MAKLTSITLLLTLSLFLASAYARKQGLFADEAEETSFLREFRPEREKLVKIQVYVHDLRIGNPNATVVEVAKAGKVTDNSPFAFGSVHVLDDLVTAGPAATSQKLGRIQGLTTNADLATFGIAMNLNFYFTAGKLAGSTLCILGRNQVMDDSREMPVVGGSGVFRFARGYAVQTTYSMDRKVNYAVLEYNIYTTYSSKLNEYEEFEFAEI